MDSGSKTVALLKSGRNDEIRDFTVAAFYDDYCVIINV